MWLFYLIVFLIPSNLAKHFILPSSYVGGSLVDYLIPTVYLTDILIVLLFIIKPLNWRVTPRPILVFLACLLPAVIFSASPIPAIYKWLRFLEVGMLAAWIKQYLLSFSSKTVGTVLTVSVIFQSILAIGQWVNQGSLFGYWFLGEQPYSAAMPGIDKITWFDGSLRVPPLGTTPHPNVLAGFLVVASSIWKGSTLPLLTTIPLFLTFSLAGWLAFLLKNKWTLLAGLTGLIIFSRYLSFLAPESSFSRRNQLTQMALNMFQDKPLIGVGLNNFTVVMDHYGLIPASTRFLQPVHNIYLLLLSETGMVGLAGFAYLILKTKKTCALWMLLFLGLFDHWPLTLQTGLLLLAFWL